MINLTPELRIGSGWRRKCYQHPEDPTKCIKVFHDTPELQKKINRRMFREAMETRRLRLIRPPFIIPKYYGEVKTDQGRGFVFDFITNNGERLPSLFSYLKDNPHRINEVRKDLYNKLMQRPVAATEIHTYNLLVLEKGGRLEYAIIDGLEDPNSLKLYSFFPYFARKNLREKWVTTVEQLDAIEKGDFTHRLFESPPKDREK